MGTEPGTAVSTEFTPSEVDDLRSLAVTQIERHRKLKLRAAAFGLGMLVLVPVWVIVEYLSVGGWPERLSNNGNPGDWNPWIVWVALGWGFYVLLTAVAIHVRRPTTEAEIQREMEHLRSTMA